MIIDRLMFSLSKLLNLAIHINKQKHYRFHRVVHFLNLEHFVQTFIPLSRFLVQAHTITDTKALIYDK